MRMLKETEGNCTLNNIYNYENYQYLCEVYADTTNIKSISVNPDFKFLYQDNIEVIGITPIAKMYMNNLQLIDERYDALSNSTLYLLDNSTYDLYDKLLFNISGVINGTQPKIENNNLSLIINLQSEQKNETEVDCIIDNTTETNYILNCKSREAIEADLQSAISFIDNNGILLINFVNGSNSIMNIEPGKINSNRLFFGKQKEGIKPGIIAAIVIILIIVLASTLFLIYYFRKKNLHIKYNSDSTIKSLNLDEINHVYNHT